MNDLVIDLDDTGYRTDPVVRVNLLKHFQQKTGELEPIEKFILSNMSKYSYTTMLRITELVKETNAEKGKLFSDYVFEHGLKHDLFMLDVKPDYVLKEYLKSLCDAGVNLHICSHRGYSKNGERYTARSLEEHYFDVKFNSIHIIDGEEHPNKVEYLNSVLKVPYILLDDNPIKETGAIIPKQKELVVWEKHHRMTRFLFQERASDVNKLNSILSQHFKGLA